MERDSGKWETNKFKKKKEANQKMVDLRERGKNKQKPKNPLRVKSGKCVLVVAGDTKPYCS